MSTDFSGWSLHGGLRVQLTPHLDVDGRLSYFTFGEASYIADIGMHVGYAF